MQGVERWAARGVWHSPAAAVACYVLVLPAVSTVLSWTVREAYVLADPAHWVELFALLLTVGTIHGFLSHRRRAMAESQARRTLGHALHWTPVALLVSMRHISHDPVRVVVIYMLLMLPLYCFMAAMVDAFRASRRGSA
jgi:hypothetical protein